MQEHRSFRLSIEMGNDAMQHPEDVARSLRSVAQMMENGGWEGTIMDDNGNTVGSYLFTVDEQ